MIYREPVLRALNAGDVRQLAELALTCRYPSVQRDADAALLTIQPEVALKGMLDVVRTMTLENRESAVSKAAAVVAQSRGRVAFEMLNSALNAPDLVEFAARTLVALTDDAQSAFASGARDVLSRAAGEGSGNQKIAVAAAFQATASEHGVALLLQLANDSDAAVRRAAVAALRPARRVTDKRLKELRLQALADALSDTDVQVRERAADSLGDWGDIFFDRAARALSAASGDLAASVRRAVVTSLARIGGETAGTALFRLLVLDPEIRETTADALIALRDADTAGRLTVEALAHSNPDVQAAVAEAIARDARAGLPEEGQRIAFRSPGCLIRDVTREGSVSETGRGAVAALSSLAGSAHPQVASSASRALSALAALLRYSVQQKSEEDRRGTAPQMLSQDLLDVDYLRTVPAPVDTIETHVHFTAFYPFVLDATRWQAMLVYVHTPESTLAVRSDCRSRLVGTTSNYSRGLARAVTPIQRGATVTITPWLAHSRFNPTHVDVLWMENFHVVEFRAQAVPSAHLYPGRILEGAIEFRVGPLLVGEIGIHACVGQADEHSASVTSAMVTEASGRMYTAVFPSYAREDSELIDRLEQAYALLNLRYFRDLRELRAGDEWRPRIRELIEGADVFQLCWSTAAQRSQHVESEWRHALSLCRPGFVKPIYWQKPLPSPPGELEHLHFQYWNCS